MANLLRSVWSKTPLARGIAAARACSDAVAFAIWMLCAVAALYLVVLPAVPGLQRLAMRKFHDDVSFGTFVALHFPPAMYAFHNEEWVSARRFSPGDPVREVATMRDTRDPAPPTAVFPRHINHLPTAELLYGTTRFGFTDGQEWFVLLRSEFMSQVVYTRVRLAPEGDHTRLSLEPVHVP